MKRKAIQKSSEAQLDPRWAAVVGRDASADGDFVYGVTTTGVYTRPSSSAKLPNPRNVVFFRTPKEAEAAGYRPSRRAAADRTSAEANSAALVTKACKWMDKLDAAPTLDELAAHVGVSPFHFHRIFKHVTGLTPKAYFAAQRAKRMRTRLLGKKATITEAIYDAGFGSNSRFYESSSGILGMRPKDYRAGGANAVIRFAVGQSALGAILVAQSEIGVCAILLGDDPQQLVRDLQDQFPRAELIGGDPSFDRVIAKVIGFVESPKLGLKLPLDIQGTAFQERVWRALQLIPVGRTASYSEIAESIGRPRAVRAVAQACAANKLAVAVPCHRVVRQDGDVSGYRWGVERKRQLLQREVVAPSRRHARTEIAA